jgi:hypothetical protein
VLGLAFPVPPALARGVVVRDGTSKQAVGAELVAGIRPRMERNLSTGFDEWNVQLDVRVG